MSTSNAPALAINQSAISFSVLSSVGQAKGEALAEVEANLRDLGYGG